jgi:hypothetical protein
MVKSEIPGKSPLFPTEEGTTHEMRNELVEELSAG